MVNHANERAKPHAHHDAQVEEPLTQADDGAADDSDDSRSATPKQDQSEDADIDKAEPRKPARRILEQEIAEGLGEIERPLPGLMLSGVSAGLDVGFSLLLMAVALSRFGDVLAEPFVDLIMANMYAIGFIFVIVGRSELFTEHTTLAILPVLNGRATVRGLMRLWTVIYGANLLGVAIFALLVTTVAPALGVVKIEAFGTIAEHMTAHGWWVILLSGVLAGWMMGLLSWLVTAGRDTISQVVLIWLVTAAIGFSGLHHSIVGSAEVLAGIFAGQGTTWLDFGHFLLWATLGNAIGGVFFVALIKYSHVLYSSAQQQEVSLTGELRKRHSYNR
ncbi:MAG: formate/nitrite transporter family protein [Caldilineaceae bacterium]|nr:formate/nitrite transporter family protein [Caldilineaceae bacterium]